MPRQKLVRLQDAGVDAYLTKPVETYRLLTTIARLSRRAESAPVEIASANQDDTPSLQGDSLVDVAKLHALLDLGGDTRFFEELVTGFLRDSRRSLQKMAVALQDRDYPMLREAIHALRGSASELGATHLVELCATLRTLKPFDLGTTRAAEMLNALQHAYTATATLLADFQSRRDESTAPNDGALGRVTQWNRFGSGGFGPLMFLARDKPLHHPQIAFVDF